MVDVTGEPKPEREQLEGPWSITSHTAWRLEDGGEAFRCCSAADADRWAHGQTAQFLGCNSATRQSQCFRLAVGQQAPPRSSHSVAASWCGAQGQACSCFAGTGWCIGFLSVQRNSMPV